MNTESPVTSYSALTSRPVWAASTGAFARAVLSLTAIAGTLDIIAAHLHMWAASGTFPTGVFKGIAGGALGLERTMQGGAEMVALGAFFHYFISFAFTLLFFLLFPRLAVLRKHVAAAGAVYGLFVSTVMTYIVLPLSALPWRAPNFANKHTYIGIVLLIAIFGLPIAFGTARFYRKHRPTRSSEE